MVNGMKMTLTGRPSTLLSGCLKIASTTESSFNHLNVHTEELQSSTPQCRTLEIILAKLARRAPSAVFNLHWGQELFVAAKTSLMALHV
jgi:hypothetical protein